MTARRRSTNGADHRTAIVVHPSGSCVRRSDAEIGSRLSAPLRPAREAGRTGCLVVTRVDAVATRAKHDVRPVLMGTDGSPSALAIAAAGARETVLGRHGAACGSAQRRPFTPSTANLAYRDQGEPQPASAAHAP